MPVYKGVEVWIEDSEYRKLNHQEVTIDLVDGRTISSKTAMLRNELYTVHCLSPISVFCEVYVITSSFVRKLAARFHLEKGLVISGDASGSSVGHTTRQFQEHGLRTPKKRLPQASKLCSVEVEIRRIDEIVKSEPCGECDGFLSEEGVTDIVMIDDFNQPPWLIFHFDIEAKGSLVASAPITESVRRHAQRKACRNWDLIPGGSATDVGSADEASEGNREYSRNFKKRSRRVRSPGIDESSTRVDSDQLQREYREEEEEERRLLRILKERLQAKRVRNMGLRRLLGECP